MTPSQIADLVDKQIGLWRRTLSQQPSRPATAQDLLSFLGLLSSLCDVVKALDAGRVHHG